MTTPSREPWWRLPRLRLAHLPTPLDEMAHLSRQLGGPMFLVKRDDLTGLAGGGNKARKLEFIIADAVGHGADVVLTVGGWQSNHCRQTAAAAAIAGLDCHLVLGGESRPPVGNLLLDHILGATIHWTSRAHRMEMLAQLAEELRGQGRQPYVVPLGGSSALGAVGYVAAMFELADQLAKRDLSVDRVLFATSSGGTQAGIVLGARLAGFSAAITAISIDQLPDGNSTSPFLAGVCRTANEAAELLGVDTRLGVEDFVTNYDYIGPGYGVVGDLERNAIRLLARTEGLLVGPVYTGRAAGAMIDMTRSGAIGPDETILFWHTGDDTALHAYSAELASC